MTIPTYSTGTVSVAANGTVVTGSGGPLWLSNVKPGDWISIDQNDLGMVIDVTADNKLTILPWKGGAKSNVAYVVLENYSARDDSGEIARDVGKLVAAQNVEGFIWYVPTTRIVPDPSRGDEGQWAYQPSTGKQWVKQGGLWGFLGYFKPLRAAGAWNTNTIYEVNDIVSLNGVSYICITRHNGAQPPNATYWQVNSAGTPGPTGPAGPTGATGPLALRPIVNWAPSIVYGIGPPSDFVQYAGSSYQCIVTHTSTASFANDLAAQVWRLVASIGPQGPTGPSGAQGPSGTLSGDFRLPGARLTLTSGVPMNVSDVYGATSIFLAPLGGGFVPRWDGTKYVTKKISELALVLDSNSAHAGYHAIGRNFDLFYAFDGADRFGTGPSWGAGAVAGQSAGAGAARGAGAGSTELQWVEGVPTNKNPITLRVGPNSGDTISVAANQATYFGTFYAVADGQAADTKSMRLLYNAYQQFERPLYVTDTTATFPYSNAAYAYYNANPANKVSVLVGLSGGRVCLTASATGTTSTSTPRNLGTAVGLDGQTPVSNQPCQYASAVAGQVVSPIAFWNGDPGLGKHDLQWLIRGTNGDTQTWLGTPSLFSGGLSGSMSN